MNADGLRQSRARFADRAKQAAGVSGPACQEKLFTGHSSGMSVIWKLKQGVQWHDGQPFTADDVVFNWEYASDPATAATTIGSYQDVEVEKVDSFTVRVRFKKPTPFWAGRANGLIIPKHLFEPYK